MLEPLPGALPRPETLARALEEAARASLARGAPRTHHLQGERPRFTNRLALEGSPYLLQHAHNPVDWWPWGDEAFAEARRLGRPVFLSVGYSTCHWCHVMERESFEDLEIARVMNQRYLAIKVDREERPDVDQVYMTAVQLLTGGGGWPMSVWLTPDREPFFGGTYFPPRDGARGAMRGFLSLLEEIADLYAADRERVSRATSSLTAAVRTAMAPAGAPAAGAPGPGPILAAVQACRARFDEAHGGTRGAPKFPSSMPVRLLLRHHRRSGEKGSLQMAVRTLEGLAAGGIHDQLAGGFHRYSTDERWQVPHFEKMLYDNALLALGYAEAWQVTGRADFARVARTTLDWVLSDMTSPEGGFYSATDADSEGEEGRFFVWTEAEVRDALGPAAERFARYYGVSRAGNWEGVNVLHVPAPEEAEWEALAPARAALLRRRAARVPPLRDEKVLASWNGLMIEAMAFAGRVLGEPRFVEAARRAAAFLLARMTVEGRLMRRWREGVAGVPGFLDDHAFVVNGLLELAEATLEPRWLEEAVRLAGETERLFGDPEGGGWWSTGSDQERLLVREKPTHDGAEPSGASAAARAVLRLAAFTADDRWRQAGWRALGHYAAALDGSPLSLTEMLLALDLATDAVREVVLAWPQGEPQPADLLQVLRRTYLPSRALMGAAEGQAMEALGRVAAVAAGKVAVGGRAAAYVCEQGACRLPATGPEDLAGQLAPARPYRLPPG